MEHVLKNIAYLTISRLLKVNKQDFELIRYHLNERHITIAFICIRILFKLNPSKHNSEKFLAKPLKI